jgi:protein involved in polysaccharide export with SLBB domain
LEYKLGPEDLLGVYIEGVPGEEGALPPVDLPESASMPPSIGFPIPVREDGTLPLPLVSPVDVRGLSTTEAEQRILEAYARETQILQQRVRKPLILVTVIRPRQAQILVIRQDSPEGRQGGTITRSLFGIAQSTGSGRRGTGAILELPAEEADVLAALAQTGGLPGSDAEDEVIIQRGHAEEAMRGGDFAPSPGDVDRGPARTVRIPLRLPPGTPPPFEPEDVALHDGDIVFIEARDTEFYYTGGLLGSFEVPLPRDYDLDVVEAVARVGGTLISGGISGNNISGSLVAEGIGGPSPSLLTVIRRLPDGRQVPIRVDLNEALRDPRENILVRTGDILVLQETPGEAFSRYLRGTFNVRILAEMFDRGSAVGTAAFSTPTAIGGSGGF